MEKPNIDKSTSSGRSGINLENPSFSKDSPKNSGRNEKLLDKDSFSNNTMRSIALKKKKYSACIDSLSDQQQKVSK